MASLYVMCATLHALNRSNQFLKRSVLCNFLEQCCAFYLQQIMYAGGELSFLGHVWLLYLHLQPEPHLLLLRRLINASEQFVWYSGGHSLPPQKGSIESIAPGKRRSSIGGIPICRKLDKVPDFSPSIVFSKLNRATLIWGLRVTQAEACLQIPQFI